MTIMVRNLNPNLIEADLRRLFKSFGEIQTVQILRDQVSNRSSGRALVGMPVATEAKQAIASLHNTQLAGKTIQVAAVAAE